MKKIYTLMAAVAIAVTTNAQSKYDVNDDGAVDISDVNAVISCICGHIPEDTPNDPEQQTVTGDATDVTNTTATLTCYANNILDNLSTDLKIGIIYCTTGTPTKNNGSQKTVSSSIVGEDGKYTITLTGLTAATTYYYRSFVYQSGVWFYGKVKSFTTKGAITFTSSVANMTCFSAKVITTYKVEDPDALGCVTDYGVYYGTTVEPSSKQSSSNAVDGKYSNTLRALLGSTTYYYRPYAVMDGKTFVGDVLSFQTKVDNVVTTGDMAEDGSVRSTLTIGGGAYSSLLMGLCWSTTSTEPTVNDEQNTTNELDEENSYTITPSKAYGTIYYRAFVKIDGVAHYGETKSCERKMPVGDYVDLGLPSHTLWATCNVGAENPEDAGLYFAWGETTGYTSDTSDGRSFDWASYKWCNGSYTTLTKYCTSSSYGTLDNKTVLESADDAATVNWGADWKMPTHAQQQELVNSNYTTTTWTTMNGVKGRLITSKSNGNSIFLPAAGYRGDANLYYVGSYGYYWSSELYSSYSGYAWLLDFYSGGVNASRNDYRYFGQSVRAVRAASQN